MAWKPSNKKSKSININLANFIAPNYILVSPKYCTDKYITINVTKMTSNYRSYRSLSTAPTTTFIARGLCAGLLIGSFVLSGSLLGCSESTSRSYRDQGGMNGGGAAIAGSTTVSPIVGQETVRFPWESWSFGRDLEGTQIQNISIIRGDESLKAPFLPAAWHRHGLWAGG